MTVSESDLKNQLEGLDWGTDAPVPAREVAASTPPLGAPEAVPVTLDALDVSVPGVKPPRRAKRVRQRAAAPRGPKAQEILDAARAGQTVAANAPTRVQGGVRRNRKTAPDVLVAAGEGPAVIALFEQMWKDVGSKLARGIGRPKISRQDAAVGWYMLLLAMRERDASK